MTTDSIPMGEAISWGWDRFKEHAAVLIIAHVVAYAIPSFVEHVGTRFAMNDFVDWLVRLASSFAMLALQLGVVNIVLRIHDGKPVKFEHLLDQVDRVGWYFLAIWLMIIVVGMGLLLFIVPGIILIIRLLFIQQFIVDERANTLDAFQRSWDITRGFAFDLFLFGLLCLAINILGFLLAGIGFFVTGPVTALATIYVYRTLQLRHDKLVAARMNPPAA